MMLLVVEHGSFSLMLSSIVLLLNSLILIIFFLSVDFFWSMHFLIMGPALERSWRENLRLVRIEGNLVNLTLVVIHLLVLAQVGE